MIIDEEFVDKCVKKNNNALIPILQDMQNYYNYLPEEVLRKVANKLQISLIDIYELQPFIIHLVLLPKVSMLFLFVWGLHVMFVAE